LLLPDCFRSSDFKSSLNQVHLKIYHALKETSDLSDVANLTGFSGIATIISGYFQATHAGRGLVPGWLWVGTGGEAHLREPSISKAEHLHREFAAEGERTRHRVLFDAPSRRTSALPTFATRLREPHARARVLPKPDLVALHAHPPSHRSGAASRSALGHPSALCFAAISHFEARFSAKFADLRRFLFSRKKAVAGRRKSAMVPIRKTKEVCL
jgi:hypothetical protein